MGCDRVTYEGNIGTHSIWNRNEVGQRLLDFAQVSNLQIRVLSSSTEKVINGLGMTSNNEPILNFND